MLPRVRNNLKTIYNMIIYKSNRYNQSNIFVLIERYCFGCAGHERKKMFSSLEGLRESNQIFKLSENEKRKTTKTKYLYK